MQVFGSGAANDNVFFCSLAVDHSGFSTLTHVSAISSYKQDVVIDVPTLARK
jgi:hypothetical protein